MPPISVIHHIHAESEYSCVPNSTTYRIDEHLEEIAGNLIVEHLFYTTCISGLGSSKVLVLGTWYLMQNLEYLVLTCTWSQSTWYLSKYFQILLSVNKYSGLNLQICFLQQVTTKHHNHKVLCVLTAWGLWTPRIGLPPLRCGCDLELLIFKFISMRYLE